jgi:catechol 2,3-dioxygenase-like lactoylglutathione lyase family enzyme
MSVDLFAGISVRDFQAAVRWYEQLLGAAPSFFPNDVEAVWELAENRWLYVEHRPEHAGHALNTVIVDNLEERIAGITQRGLEPAVDETYENGVRKVTYRDPEGNEIGFGGTPHPDDSAS